MTWGDNLTLFHSLRRQIRRLGLDVRRYPEDTLEARCIRLLKFFSVSVVLDVGANEGQFGSQLRELGYDQRIISFEPLSEPARLLSERAEGDSRWEVVRAAVGDSIGTATIHIAANSVSSSLLPILDRHVEAAPSSRYVGSEQVSLVRLDDAAKPFLKPSDRVFVKIDVQGYQREVLCGAKGIDDLVVGLQVEFSLLPLYEGEMLFSEGLSLLKDQGFSLMGIEPGFIDLQSGRTLQVDAIFFRESKNSSATPI